MASDHTLIAVAWRGGEYAVLETKAFNTTREIDWTALLAAHPLKDVAPDVGYADGAAVLAPFHLEEFIRGPEARAFADRTKAAGAFFYLVHRAEWESGLA